MDRDTGPVVVPFPVNKEHIVDADAARAGEEKQEGKEDKQK